MAKRGNPNWAKGKSGNPGGRPKALIEVQDLARLHTPEAIAALVSIVKTSDTDSARVAAAVAILNRGWGQPKQDSTLTVKHSFVEALRELERIAREPAGLGTSVAQIEEQPAPLRH